MKKVALCICTYHRPDGLSRLLNDLKVQEAPDGWTIETRVINNDPQADQAIFVRHVQDIIPDAIVAFESRQNIAHARNTCLMIGPADAYAFIDDDERPSSCWLSSLLVRLDDQTVDAVFGPVLGIQDDHTSRWLKKTGAFDKLGPDHDGDIGWDQTRTSSTLVRGTLLGPGASLFDPKFGQSGGSDTELFRRLELAGARFVHERRALVYEENDPSRCNMRAVVRRRYQAGVVYGRIKFRNKVIQPAFHVVSRVGMGLLEMFVGVLFICLGKPGVAFRGLCRGVCAIGSWRGRNPNFVVVRYMPKPISPEKS